MYSVTVRALLCLLLSTTVLSLYPTEVIPLESHDFEHKTQAATGQTTGHWFVLFCTDLEPACERAMTLWEDLAKDEEKSTIFAQVDLTLSPAVGGRFQVQHIPSAILLRDRKVYKYAGALEGAAAAQAVYEFLDAGYAEQATRLIGMYGGVVMIGFAGALMAFLGMMLAAWVAGFIIRTYVPRDQQPKILQELLYPKDKDKQQ